jgi:hypothetical protein
MITQEPIPPERLHVLNSAPYNVHSLANLVHHAQYVRHAAPAVPHTRRRMSTPEIAAIQNHATRHHWTPPRWQQHGPTPEYNPQNPPSGGGMRWPVVPPEPAPLSPVRRFDSPNYETDRDRRSFLPRPPSPPRSPRALARDELRRRGL